MASRGEQRREKNKKELVESDECVRVKICGLDFIEFRALKG